MDMDMDEHVQELLNDYRAGRVERRDFLRWAAILGMTVPLAPLLDIPGYTPSAMAARPRVGHGGTMKVVTSAPTTIEPPDLIDEPGIGIVQAVGEYLVHLDDHLIPRPHLATHWSASDSFKTWTFTLRQGVRLHNGKTMTADDVVATFKRLVDPKSHHAAALSALSFLTPQGVTKVDQFTVRFHLERAVSDFPIFLNTTYQAVILPADWPGNFAKHPIGTGPFKLVEYVTQQHAKYVRNPDYWQAGLPYLDGLEIILGLAPENQVTALQSGSADVQLLTSSDALPLLRGNPDIHVLTAPSGGFNGIFVRCDVKPFSDKRVRQAMALCLNRPAMVKTLSGGVGSVGNDNVIPPVYPVYSPIPQRVQNLAMARSLLSAAGHPNGFSIQLTTASDTAGLVAMATVAQQMWAAAGIKVSIKSEPGSVYYNTDWLQSPLTITEWAFRPALGGLFGPAFTSNGVWNASHWKNPAFDRLATAYDATNDLKQRTAIAKQIETIMTDETPAILPVFGATARSVRKNVTGIAANPSSFIDYSRARFTS